MTVYQLRKHAEEMQATFRDAALSRLRYLRGEMHRHMAMAEAFTEADLVTAQVADIIHGDRFRELAEEQAAIVTALRHPDQRPGRITEQQVEQARAYPVSKLVDLTRGRALAWCHDDHRPSLYLAPRINKLVCPVCNLYFDSISTVMQRDGLTFKDAVCRLAA